MNKPSGKLVAVIGVGIAVLGLAGWFVLSGNKRSDSQSSPIIVAPTPVPTASGTAQTYSGEFLCLPHTNTDGPQTMECALGLKSDTGVYYGLQDTTSDYSLIGSVPTGTHVQVTGIFEAKTSTTYPTVGTIQVTAITKN